MTVTVRPASDSTQSMIDDARQSPGYTLIEVLIMLAITAILTTTVLELVRSATSNGVRIERAARFATGTVIDLAGLRHSILNVRSDYRNGEAVFSGDETGFTARCSSARCSCRW